jgi:hypothetical protein
MQWIVGASKKHKWLGAFIIEKYIRTPRTKGDEKLKYAQRNAAWSIMPPHN